MVQDLAGEIALIQSLEETPVIRRDTKKWKSVEGPIAPLHFVLWMECGQAGENGAPAAELVGEGKKQENAFAETDSMEGETVQAHNQKLKIVTLEVVLWMVTGTLMGAGVVAVRPVVGERNTEPELVTNLGMEASTALEMVDKPHSVTLRLVRLLAEK